MNKLTSSMIATSHSFERWIALSALCGLIVLLFIIIAMPLWSLLSKSMQDQAGTYIGLANFITYFATPVLVQALSNSLWVAVITT